jgi:hypothetical protein
MPEPNNPHPRSYINRIALSEQTCSGYARAEECRADAANSCSWQPATVAATPSCLSHLELRAFEACKATPDSQEPACLLYHAIAAACTKPSQPTCNAVPFCIYDSFLGCCINPTKTAAAIFAVAPGLGSALAGQAQAQDLACLNITSPAECSKALGPLAAPSGAEQASAVAAEAWPQPGNGSGSRPAAAAANRAAGCTMSLGLPLLVLLAAGLFVPHIAEWVA